MSEDISPTVEVRKVKKVIKKKKSVTIDEHINVEGESRCSSVQTSDVTSLDNPSNIHLKVLHCFLFLSYDDWHKYANKSWNRIRALYQKNDMQTHKV